MESRTFHRTLNRQELHRLARTLVVHCPPPLWVALEGSLGAGKTEFVRAFCRPLGIQEVRSPTFVLMHTYAGLRRHDPVQVHHVDLYRLDHPEELWMHGLEERLQEEAYVLVEWADRWPEFQQMAHLRLRLLHTAHPEIRDVHLLLAAHAPACLRAALHPPSQKRRSR
jgi:ATPase, YjeE family